MFGQSFLMKQMAEQKLRDAGADKSTNKTAQSLKSGKVEREVSKTYKVEVGVPGLAKMGYSKTTREKPSNKTK